MARPVLEKTFQVLATFSKCLFLDRGRILKKWSPCYSLGMEVATALWWLRELVQLVLGEGPGLAVKGLKPRLWASPGAQCLLWSGKHEYWLPPLMSD